MTGTLQGKGPAPLRAEPSHLKRLCVSGLPRLSKKGSAATFKPSLQQIIRNQHLAFFGVGDLLACLGVGDGYSVSVDFEGHIRHWINSRSDALPAEAPGPVGAQAPRPRHWDFGKTMWQGRTAGYS